MLVDAADAVLVPTAVLVAAADALVLVAAVGVGVTDAGSRGLSATPLNTLPGGAGTSSAPQFSHPPVLVARP